VSVDGFRKTFSKRSSARAPQLRGFHEARSPVLRELCRRSRRRADAGAGAGFRAAGGYGGPGARHRAAAVHAEVRSVTRVARGCNRTHRRRARQARASTSTAPRASSSLTRPPARRSLSRTCSRAPRTPTTRRRSASRRRARASLAPCAVYQGTGMKRTVTGATTGVRPGSFASSRRPTLTGVAAPRFAGIPLTTRTPRSATTRPGAAHIGRPGNSTLARRGRGARIRIFTGSSRARALQVGRRARGPRHRTRAALAHPGAGPWEAPCVCTPYAHRVHFACTPWSPRTRCSLGSYPARTSHLPRRRSAVAPTALRCRRPRRRRPPARRSMRHRRQTPAHGAARRRR
jgi:hypothetical protein